MKETRVLITGSSRGLGRALATELARSGYAVAATARNLDDLNDLPWVDAIALDVNDQESIDEAVASAGPVDVLINNAGITAEGPLETLPFSKIEEVLDVNVLGPLRVSRAVLPGMRQRGRGRIVNVSSTAAGFAPPLQGAYSASKAALERLSDALRYEASHFGVTVTCVVPGALATDMTHNQLKRRTGDYESLVQQQHERMANHRGGPTQDAAERIVAVFDLGDMPRRIHVGTTIDRLFDRLPAPIMRRLSTTGLNW